MTAEIAILNKSAVALATDSAVTISAGDQAVKIFESADKLFELSCSQPIGLMIYNGMQFLGVPLETVIKGFRQNDKRFKTMQETCNAFLNLLYEYVDKAPDEELFKSISGVISPIAQEISKKIGEAVLDKLTEGEPPETKEEFQSITEKTRDDVLNFYETTVKNLDDALFLPRPDRKEQKEKYKKLILRAVENSVEGFAAESMDRIVKICTKIMKSDYMSGNKTGLVFAGFAETENFPTLISYEVDGVYNAKVRASKTEFCDIDRNGVHALVRPFAQKEMVDRFLHGLDDRLRNDITEYCKTTIASFSKGIFDSISFEDEEKRNQLLTLSKDAEAAFIRNLNSEAFRSIEQTSRREIEDMVEFMPKPELAKMAEALIDLTSIKRKVSQGLETVGGPVDVAVISKNDGFVWVKRKHYFPAELNSRFFDRRTQNQTGNNRGENDE